VLPTVPNTLLNGQNHPRRSRAGWARDRFWAGPEVCTEPCQERLQSRSLGGSACLGGCATWPFFSPGARL